MPNAPPTHETNSPFSSAKNSPKNKIGVNGASHQNDRSNGDSGGKETPRVVQIVRDALGHISEEDRKHVIVDLLKDCSVNDLEAISSLIGNLRVSAHSSIAAKGVIFDPFTVIPAPVVLKILSLLDPLSLYRCVRVSRLWHKLGSDSSLWKSLCQHETDYRLCNAEAERVQIQHHTLSDGTVRWKEAFAERFRLWTNWLNGRCAVRTLYGHDQGVVCVQFDGNRVVSGSSDSTIRSWDLESEDGAGLSGHTLQGHSDTVRCLHLVGNTLASGSNDCNIKIWNLERTERWSSIGCRRTMMGHSNIVRCLEMGRSELVSGSYDASLKLWSLDTGAIIRTFAGHSESVLCEQFCEEESRVVSGSSDTCIKMWDTRIGRDCMAIHKAHTGSVTCIRMDNTRIVSGSLDKTIKMWDVRTGRLLRAIDWRSQEGHTGVVRCIQADSWRIVSSADDRTIKVWKLSSGERLCTLRDHTDGVTCLQFNDNRMVSGSYDKTVKVWDFALL